MKHVLGYEICLLLRTQSNSSFTKEKIKKKEGANLVPYIILAMMVTGFYLNGFTTNRLTRVIEKSGPAGFSGDDIAKRILGMKEIKDVKVVKTDIKGDPLYHPLKKTIELGPDVYILMI